MFHLCQRLDARFVPGRGQRKIRRTEAHALSIVVASRRDLAISRRVLTARRIASGNEPFRNLYFTSWERLTYVHVGTGEESVGRHRADQKEERERAQCPSVH